MRILIGPHSACPTISTHELSILQGKLKEISNKPFESNQKYVKASVRYVSRNLVRIRYPFQEYYMNEYDAPQAEATYRQARRDSSLNAYAIVSVKNGNSVLKSLMINEIPIEDFNNL